MSTAALPERLMAFSRYVALVAEQLQALQTHDTARLQVLAEERAVLEAEMWAAEADAEEDEEAVAAAAVLSALLEAGLDQLRQSTAHAQQKTQLWMHLESGTLRAARALAATARRAGSYAEPAPPEQAQVDVKF